MSSALTQFDAQASAAIARLLIDKHLHIAALDENGKPKPNRTYTQRNYHSSINGLMDFMAASGVLLPTRGTLEKWRDAMLEHGYAVRTVNAKLAAARKLLRAVADDVTDIQAKMSLRDWANVADTKAVQVQDKIERDYGLRLSRAALENLIASIPTDSIKGLRDKALIAVMSGAGLRVSEAVALTMRDVFQVENEARQIGIRVQHGKHSKSRVVVLSGKDSWVLKTVDAYAGALGLTLLEHADECVFRGVRPVAGGGFVSRDERLSTRGAQRAVNAYAVEHDGRMVQISAHDLRRTFAKLCRKSGMSWDALREQMGHSSVKITEKYVGLEVDWSERKPGWSLDLKA